MALTIVKGYPPNFRDIVAAFPSARAPQTIFCWGEIVFNPTGGPLGPELLVHEAVHSQRMGKGLAQIASWWGQYLRDAGFRLAEELPAHRAEYRWLADNDARHEARHRDRIAKRLSSPLYGRMIPFNEALQYLVKP